MISALTIRNKSRTSDDTTEVVDDDGCFRTVSLKWRDVVLHNETELPVRFVIEGVSRKEEVKQHRESTVGPNLRLPGVGLSFFSMTLGSDVTWGAEVDGGSYPVAPKSHRTAQIRQHRALSITTLVINPTTLHESFLQKLPLRDDATDFHLKQSHIECFKQLAESQSTPTPPTIVPESTQIKEEKKEE